MKWKQYLSGMHIINDAILVVLCVFLDAQAMLYCPAGTSSKYCCLFVGPCNRIFNLAKRNSSIGRASYCQ